MCHGDKPAVSTAPTPSTQASLGVRSPCDQAHTEAYLTSINAVRDLTMIDISASKLGEYGKRGPGIEALLVPQSTNPAMAGKVVALRQKPSRTSVVSNLPRSTLISLNLLRKLLLE